MQKIDFATFPVSVSSWIVLRDCFQECSDPEMLYKIFYQKDTNCFLKAAICQNREIRRYFGKYLFAKY